MTDFPHDTRTLLRCAHRERLHDSVTRADVENPVLRETETARDLADRTTPLPLAREAIECTEVLVFVADDDERAGDERTIRRPLFRRLLLPSNLLSRNVDRNEPALAAAYENEQQSIGSHGRPERGSAEFRSLPYFTGLDGDPVQIPVVRPCNEVVAEHDQRRVRAIRQRLAP